MLFIYFSCHIALAPTPSTMLNRNGESGIPCSIFSHTQMGGIQSFTHPWLLFALVSLDKPQRGALLGQLEDPGVSLGQCVLLSCVLVQVSLVLQVPEGKDGTCDFSSLCCAWNGWSVWQILTANQVIESCSEGLCVSLSAPFPLFCPKPKAVMLPSPSFPLQKPEWKETWKKRAQVSPASGYFHAVSSFKNKPEEMRGGGWQRGGSC